MKNRKIIVREKYAKNNDGNYVVVKKCCVDSSSNYVCGEYVTYFTSGNLECYGFCRESYTIGAWKYYNSNGNFREFRFYSLLNNELGKLISDLEYKKQIALLRLGEINCPELDILIKDYE